MKNKRVVVALSGGVDSSVTAMLLKKAGYDVHGVIMSIWDENNSGNYEIKRPGCYGPDEKEDIETAQKVADKLKIPLTVVDLRKEYNEYIIKYFIEEYKNGRTANPCVQCNKNIKFGFLVEKIKNIVDFDYFATGHYARIYYDENIKEYKLLKAIDKSKDQSYFLYNLNQEKLKILLFPMGEYKKSEIKEMAKELDLKLELKKESTDFFSIGSERLLEKIKNKEGEIVYIDGKILGKHKGIQYFTIGQRKGLNIALGKPVYVISIDKEKNKIVVGEEKYLFKKTFTVTQLNWISSKLPKAPLKVKAKIRYRTAEEDAIIKEIENGVALVEFYEKQRAITPGQSAVFYDGEVLLGGGVIENVIE